MKQMYFGEPFFYILGKNLFCRGGLLTKQILKVVLGHFDVHRSTSVHLASVFACSFAVLMYQMYFDVVRVVYGDLFAMWIFWGAVMYFSTGEELHRYTFSSSGAVRSEKLVLKSEEK